MKTALSGNSSPIHARTERGYSLAEILVVLAVFAVLIVAALMVYDQSNKVFKQSVESSDMQQSTRVAFDKLVSELRLAGFDFDRDGIPFGSLAGDWKSSSAYTLGALVQPSPPNGHVYICIGGGTSGAAAPAWPTAAKTDIDDGSVKWEEDGNVQYQQPDEQIEYAGNSAITFRGNFNYETYTAPCPDDGSGKICENGREAWLESAEFPLVTTSNSEIVTYALVSNSGNASANKDTVDFYADIDKPRDVSPKTGNKEAAVSITGIDLSNKYPPYTLYRYTLDDNGKAVGVPIADNIRSLTFRYFADTAATTKQEIGCGDAAVCTVADLPFGKGQFDGNKPDVDIIERDVRQKIKSVRLALVGMNPQQDASFNDTSDAYAPNYRKFPLETVVVPRNLGKHGLKEFNTTLPEPPELKSVCIGACNAAFLTWAAPKSGGDIDSYNVVYSPGDCSSPKLTYAIAEDAGKNLSGYASKAIPGTQYQFAIQAVNKYGSSTSGCVTATPINKTTPDIPTALNATGGADPTLPAQANKIQLTWPATTTNKAGAQTMTCSDGSTQSAASIPWAEQIYYRIYRSTSPTFNPPAGSTKILDENTAPQPSASGSNLAFTDAKAANCIPYYYKMEAVSSCVKSNTMNSTNSTTQAESTYYTGTGVNGILGQATTVQVPATPSGLAVNNQSCSLLCDVTFGWLAVSTDTSGNPMNVGRYKLYVNDGATGTPIAGSPFTVIGTSKTVTNLDPGLVAGYKVSVSAYDCNEGAQSTQIIWPCSWDGGTVTVSPNTSYGGSGTSASPWAVQTPDSLTVVTQNVIKQIDYTVTQNAVVVGSGTDIGPKKTFTVALPALTEGISTRVRIALTSSSGTCAITQNYFVIDNPPPSCSLKDIQTDATVVSTSGKNVNVILKNSSTNLLKIKKIIVKWNTSYAGGNPNLGSIDYPNTSAGTSTFNAGNCQSPTVVADISSNAANLTSLQSNYNITIHFSHNTTSSTITSICIVYQAPTGDILACQIHPNANTCTNLSGAICQ